MKKLLALLFVAASVLAACQEPADPVPTAVIDQNQIISMNNAEKNATTFRNKRYPDAVRVLMDSDSSIKPNCRYGDGWASGNLEMKDGTMLAVKCQTNGSGKGFSGCLLKSEFITKDYAEQDGQCDETITELPKFK